MEFVKVLVVALLITTVLATAWVSASTSQIDPNAKLAEWNGGYVTVSEYKSWWQRMDPKERPQLNTIEDRLRFLENIINLRLMVAEAESLRLDLQPSVQEWLTKQRVNLLKKELEAEAIEPRIKIPQDLIDQNYNRRLTRIIASHIVVPSSGLAKAIFDSLRLGGSFEELAIRYSTDVTASNGGYIGPVRWGDFSDRWCEHAFALEPGQVSEPLPTESGYIIIKIHEKEPVKVDNPELERKRIEMGLYKQKFQEEWLAFRDSLMLAYRVRYNDQALIRLATRFAQKIEELGLNSVVIDQDVVPDLMENEEKMDVVSYENGSFTCAEVVDMILSVPYPVRPRLDDPDGLQEFISRQLTDTLYVTEAVKRGLDNSPNVKDGLERIRQRRLVMSLYRYVTADVTVPDDSVVADYERHKSDYVTGPGYIVSKIVVGTKEAADSVLMRLKAGEAFEQVARQRSVDRFTAPNGGDMGFLAVGQDPEFDEFLATMKEGEIKIFRSVEGWVVLWLREARGSRIRTFDEVAEIIRNRLLGVYRDRFIEKWIEEKRKLTSVRIDTDLLSSVSVSSP